MKSNYTYIAEVLDRSGSMAVIADATRNGHNEFLRGQKAAPGECGYLLAQFDNVYETVYDGPVAQAPELTPLNYQPRGSTALLDAIGSTVTGLGQKLDALPEDQRPEKVVVVILTDGEENASRIYTRKQIFDLITQQRDIYQWQFVFLGANQDAIAEAGKLGIQSVNAATYAAANVGNTYCVMTNKVASFRAADNYHAGAQVMSFTEDERRDLEKEKGK